MVPVPPDEAAFVAVVTTALDTTREQVTQAFNDLGISNPAVTSLAVGINPYNGSPAGQSQLYYQVAFSTAPAAMKDIAKKLDALAAALPSGILSMQFTGSLNASQAAVDAVHRTLLPDLIADARASAQTLAAAGGLKLGGILGLTEYQYGSAGQAAYLLSFGPGQSSSSGSPATQYTFSATVKFAVQ
jgi:uncharacterized protein YggE